MGRTILVHGDIIITVCCYAADLVIEILLLMIHERLLNRFLSLVKQFCICEWGRHKLKKYGKYTFLKTPCNKPTFDGPDSLHPTTRPTGQAVEPYIIKKCANEEGSDFKVCICTSIRCNNHRPEINEQSLFISCLWSHSLSLPYSIFPWFNAVGSKNKYIRFIL